MLIFIILYSLPNSLQDPIESNPPIIKNGVIRKRVIPKINSGRNEDDEIPLREPVIINNM